MIKQLQPMEFSENRIKDLILDLDSHLYQISEILESNTNGKDLYEDYMISFREHLAAKEYTFEDVFKFWKAMPAYLKVIIMHLGVVKKEGFSIHEHQVLIETFEFLEHIEAATTHNLKDIELKVCEQKVPKAESVKIKRKYSFSGLLYRSRYEIIKI